jgi:hypothetical protein
MSGAIFGFPGDSFDHIWMNWWYAYSRDHHLNWEQTSFIDAPVGKDFSQLAMQPTWRWSGLALAKIGGEIFAFNFLMLASFFLSGVTMYFLARHIGAARGAAFIAGAAYMLCPYHIWHSYQHLSLAAIQWMPLYVLTLLWLRERATVPRAVLCGAVFALVTLENYWYGGFMLLVTVLFMLISLLWKAKEEERFTLREVLCALLAVVVGAAAVAPWVAPIAARSLAGKEPLWPAMQVYQRSEEDAAALAASPADYARPASNHPLWSRTIAPPRFAQEKTLYIGIVVLALALVGLAGAARRGNRPLFAGIFFAFVVVVAFNISLAPFAAWSHSLAPMFRAYARLGVLVEMSLCALAALGISAIAARRTWGNVALIGIFILVVADFAYLPAKSVTDVSKTPEVYRWLAAQDGDFIVTEFPTPRFTNYDRFFQRIDHKRVLSNDRLDQIADLQTFAQLRQTQGIFGGEAEERGLFRHLAARLAGYGVKYVIVHLRDPFPYNPVLRSFVDKGTDVTFQWTPEQIAKWSEGVFEEAARFDDAVVYRVIAKPVKILMAATDGRTLIIGGPEVSRQAGTDLMTFDILWQGGRGEAATAEIVLETEASLFGDRLRGEGTRYVLTVPLRDVETLADITGVDNLPPEREASPRATYTPSIVKIVSFRIITGTR